MFTNNPNEFEVAFYCPAKGDRITRHAIGVEIVKDNELRFNTLVQNLIVDNRSTILKTTYNYDYKDGNELSYRGRWYIVRGVAVDKRALNPQALAFTNFEGNNVIYLDILEVQ